MHVERRLTPVEKIIRGNAQLPVGFNPGVMDLLSRHPEKPFKVSGVLTGLGGLAAAASGSVMEGIALTASGSTLWAAGHMSRPATVEYYEEEALQAAIAKEIVDGQ